MSHNDLQTGTPRLRNPYALPARQRGRRILKDRRQGRGGARDGPRRWLSAYLQEQLTPDKEATP